MKRVVENNTSGIVEVKACNILCNYYGITHGNKKYFLTNDYTLIEPAYRFKTVSHESIAQSGSAGGTTEALKKCFEVYKGCEIFEFDKLSELLHWALL